MDMTRTRRSENKTYRMIHYPVFGISVYIYINPILNNIKAFTMIEKNPNEKSLRFINILFI